VASTHCNGRALRSGTSTRHRSAIARDRPPPALYAIVRAARPVRAVADLFAQSGCPSGTDIEAVSVVLRYLRATDPLDLSNDAVALIRLALEKAAKRYHPKHTPAYFS
jgi:hypothetical protein